MAAPAVLSAVYDDDDLLRCICELGDQNFLRTARVVSNRLREFTAPVIRAQLTVSRNPKGETYLRKYHELGAFLTEKLSNMTLRATHQPEIEADQREALIQMRDIYIRRFEGGIAASMICETCPMIRMQHCVLCIAQLRAEGILGPHVIITPSPNEWKRAFEAIAPNIPLIVNEGTPSERWNKLLTQSRVAGGNEDFVWISSYALAMKDTSNFAKFLKVCRFKALSCAILDNGLVELRRGWKQGSATWKLFHNFVLKTPRLTSAFILGSQASTNAFDGADIHWLVDALVSRFAGEDIDLLDKLCKASFYDPLRGFGVGKREAPVFYEPLTNALFRELVEAFTACIYCHGPE